MNNNSILSGLTTAFLFCMFTSPAIAQSIPNAEWRAGFTGGGYSSKLTPDGSRLTVSTQYDLKILDVKTMRCVYVDDYALHRREGVEVVSDGRYAAPNETGEYIVTIDKEGSVEWRRVSDTAVMSSVKLPMHQDAIEYFISDTVIFVAYRDTGSYVSLSGIVTPSTKRAWPLRVNDTLIIMQTAQQTSVVHEKSRDTLFTARGYWIGTDYAHRFYVAVDSMIVRYNTKSNYASDTVITNTTPNAERLLRKRYLLTRAGVIDVVDDSFVTTLAFPSDILPDGMAVQYENATNKMLVRSSDGRVDSIQTFDGPVTEIAQDVRDSLVFVQTGSTLSDNRGRLGRIGFITDDGVVLGNREKLVNWAAARTITDSVCVPFDFAGQVSTYGYFNLDRLRAGKPPVAVVIHDTATAHGYHRPTVVFNSNGDTLRYADRYVTYSTCEPDITLDSATTVGFVPTTPFYVVGRNMYSTEDCAWYLDLVDPVVAISPTRDRVLMQRGDSLVLSETIRSGFRYNAISRDAITLGTWSDAGSTARLMRDTTAFVSLHSDGTTTTAYIPAPMQSPKTQWQWSHDGTVATGIKRDTLVSIDARTGQILREYNAAPWLTYISDEVRAICLVGPVDGRLIVSLPGGAVATFPGIDLPVVSSVAGSPRPLRHLTGTSLGVAGALPQSSVQVYSLLGELVAESATDVQGQCDFTDRGLPHGAYVAVYQTISGMESRVVLR